MDGAFWLVHCKRSTHMATTEHTIVVGIFRDHTPAAQAINELHSAGFRDDKIRVGRAATVSSLLDHLPDISIGYEAESRTLPDELVDKGVPQDEAYYYEQEFKAGHSIVIVESDGHQREVRDILRHHGAYDANIRAEQTEGNRTIPVREEILQAHKQSVKIGEVI